MLKLLLCSRYLRRRKVVYLSVAALALSVALLIVVSSLFTGFIAACEQSAVDVIGDVLISCPVRFTQHERLIERLEAYDQVQAATAVMLTQGLLHLGKGNVRAVQIFGIEPERFQKVIHFRESLRGTGGLAARMSPQDSTMRGFVSIGVVTEPNELTDEYDYARAREALGLTVSLTTGSLRRPDTQAADRGPVRPRRASFQFTVADVIRSGHFFFDRESVFLPLDRLCRKLDPSAAGTYVQRVQIKLSPTAERASAIEEIESIWQAFGESIQLGYNIQLTDVITAVEMQARYVGEIRKQMGMLMVIFGIVDVGVIALIFCIFYMIVRLKQRDIGIIRSCGGSAGAVAAIFLGFGAVVGLVGALLGVLLGYLFTANINRIEAWVAKAFGLNLWSSSLYVFEKIPNTMDWGSAGFIGLAAIAAASVGVLIPALLAARTRPVEVLRYE